MRACVCARVCVCPIYSKKARAPCIISQMPDFHEKMNVQIKLETSEW